MYDLKVVTSLKTILKFNNNNLGYLQNLGREFPGSNWLICRGDLVIIKHIKENVMGGGEIK